VPLSGGLLRHESAYEVIRQIAALPGLDLAGIYSHFPSAYDDYEFSEAQIETMRALIARLAADGIEFRWRHMANSDGINNLPLSFAEPFNLARTGINLYGVFDLEGKQTLALEPVITMRTQLAAVRTLPAGATIGYGRTCELAADTRVGTIAMGYADGMPIGMSNAGYVMVHGKHCKILGRVSMDYTTINLDGVPDAQPGDDVECLGRHITVGDWARFKQSIPYDIICSLGHRVARVYRGA
jgi:alanine racemase